MPAADQNILAVASDSAISDFKAYEFALDAFFFLFHQPIAADEFAFVEFTNPAEIGFEQCRRLINLVTVETHARLQPQRITRSQTTRQHAVIGSKVSCLENLVPDLLGFVRGGVNFKAVLAGVTRPRDD